MAMVRSTSRSLSRRLSRSSATTSMLSRREPDILQAPPLSLPLPRCAWIPRPGPAIQPTRTFMSPAATARTRRIPNLQGQQHFPVVSKGTESMKWAEQKRFLSVERKESTAERVITWLDRNFGPRRQLIVVMVGGVSSFMAMTILYRRISTRLDEHVRNRRQLASQECN